MLSREDIAFMYLEQLPFESYPFQEEAILDGFSSEQGTLVCAPTGMGKTLIAEAGIYEAMKTGNRRENPDENGICVDFRYALCENALYDFSDNFVIRHQKNCA